MESDDRVIRALGPDDAVALRALRLRGLREDPTPFLSTYAEENGQPVEETAERLRASTPGTGVLGAFRSDALRGMLGYYRQTRLKACHRASLWGMYVAPEERRRGTARALVAEAIARIRAVEGIDQVELTVVRGEEPARSLYRSFGFEVEGVLRRAMRTGSESFDEELFVLFLDRAGPSSQA